MEGIELKPILMQMDPFVDYVQSWSPSSPLPPPPGDMTEGGGERTWRYKRDLYLVDLAQSCTDSWSGGLCLQVIPCDLNRPDTGGNQ